MTQDYLIGSQLDEYRLENLLGRGGMARVYRALDINLNRYVAIKVIDIPHRAEGEYVQRFQREAQAIAQLDHPHIVRLYRYGEAQAGQAGDSVLYMAMQYIEGSDLQFVLNTYRQDGEYIENTEAGRIISEVCMALDYAHSRGIIHRDIKTANIMLDTQGRAVLTDFGLAMLSTQATRGEIFGSPHYIAPEQAMSSARAVPQSDLYSVGVVLYEMLTGVLPFNAAEPLELALMHMSSGVPSPREVRPEINPELEAVMLKALEKRPEDRYPTGRALADALNAALLPKNQAAPIDPVGEPVGYRTAVRPPLPTIILRQEAAGRFEPGDPALPSAPSSIASAPGQPALKKSNRGLWVAGGLAALLLFLLCLGGASLIIVNQLLTKTENPVAGKATVQTPAAAEQKTSPTQTQSQPTPAAGETVQAPEAGHSGLVNYQFTINRRGEDKGYFVLINTGSSKLPVSEMRLRVERGEIVGSAWGVDALEPGLCLLAVKEDKKEDDLPRGVDCEQAGQTLSVSNSQDSVFKETLDVYLGDLQVGSCERDEQYCQVSFSW